MMADKQDESREAVAMMGQFIAEGLIECLDVNGKESWELTANGLDTANQAMRKLTTREQALALLLAASLIREGK